jgi:hypothetical protein
MREGEERESADPISTLNLSCCCVQSSTVHAGASKGIYDDDMASGSSSSAPTQHKAHYSGLWIGQAVPDKSLASEIPINPIKWSLSLLPDQSGCSVSAFGAGFVSSVPRPQHPPLAHDRISVYSPPGLAFNFNQPSLVVHSGRCRSAPASTCRIIILLDPHHHPLPLFNQVF